MALAVCPFQKGDTNIFAGTVDINTNPHGVFRFDRSDSSWTEINSGLTNLIVFDFAVVPNVNDGADIFVSTGNGVFVCKNDTTWNAVSEGLPNTYARALAVKGTDLYVGTDSGLYRRPLSEITAVSQNAKPLPVRFLLNQNYPNPFNPSTIITYQLPTSGNVVLRVYDVLGRQVRSLVNERQTAGFHSITFIPGDLASGVYFYTLQTGVYHSTKKLVMMK